MENKDKQLQAVEQTLTFTKNSVNLNKEVAKRILDSAVTNKTDNRYNSYKGPKMKTPYIIVASLLVVLVAAAVLNLKSAQKPAAETAEQNSANEAQVASLTKGNSDQEISQDVTVTQQDLTQIDNSLKEIDQDFANSGKDDESKITEN